MILYHNPRCTKSREALKLLEEREVDVEVIRYLDAPLDEAALREVAGKLGMSPRDMMRVKEVTYKELSLKDADDDALFTAMAENPVLMERPILVNGDRAVIGRPPEQVLDIL
ncbi:arsenate reductase (glutaredoxin) [Parvularcula sp. LCG005]|uniref:arsenate reductase (glutaredoxin) n=1 Tax=Parvularcula sp. LCG005 TaxID=3078805 RepID=UPI00294336D8|nr:arsenate reductase (glutaredoxin) [Parvularcula sp. LCG005]WOI52555.1 arsenate reductase (glutaredoxin) [Parvularcula sp. LCG005]